MVKKKLDVNSLFIGWVFVFEKKRRGTNKEADDIWLVKCVGSLGKNPRDFVAIVKPSRHYSQ